MNKIDKRRAQTRKTIRGTAEKPRLVVFASNRYFYGQIIDDDKRVTLVSVNKMTDATEAGKALAEAAKIKKITTIVFDRAGMRYHGNIKKFAEGAREAGLVF